MNTCPSPVRTPTIASRFNEAFAAGPEDFRNRTYAGCFAIDPVLERKGTGDTDSFQDL